MNEYDIESAFSEIEDILMESMVRNLKRHKIEEISEGKQWVQWQAEQLKALELYKKQNAKQFSGRFSDINSSISDILAKARKDGQTSAEAEILEQIRNGFSGYKKQPAGLTGEFFRLNTRKLDALVNATQNDFQRAEQAILRMSNDRYRKVIYNAQVYANTGAGTYEQAVDMATKDFMAAGLNCVEYKNGARHTLKNYASMAIRTASKRAYLTGEGEKRDEWGIHTVFVNYRTSACPLCVPFVGKVLIDDVYSNWKSTEGSTYPLMSQAMAAGFLHPNCKDIYTTWFEGVNEDGKKWTKEELSALEKKAKDDAQQRYAERQAEKYDRMSRFSLDKNNQKKYSARKSEWESRVKNENPSAENNSIAKNNGSGIIEMNLQFFAFKKKQIGKKIGKHAEDYGLDPSKVTDRVKMNEIINDIVSHSSEVRTGNWRGQEEDVLFYIKGDDVVVTKQDNEFVTILKGGVNNARVKNARIK